MSCADARIHIEHNAARRSSSVHEIDPLARKVSQCREVHICREPLRLEAPHLAWRSRVALHRLTADNPAHRRIVTQPFGVVHVLIAGETAEHRLPQQTDQRVATILTGARIGEHLAGQRSQSERIVKLAIGEQSGIGGDDAAAKLQQQAAVKIEPKGTRFLFTHPVRHRGLPQSQISSSSLYLNRGTRCENQQVIRGIRV
jgi:hypothetical protein